MSEEQALIRAVTPEPTPIVIMTAGGVSSYRSHPDLVESPTPRTDANCEVWLVTPNVELEDGRPISWNVVEADFARTLECELAAAQDHAELGWRERDEAFRKLRITPGDFGALENLAAAKAENSSKEPHTPETRAAFEALISDMDEFELRRRLLTQYDYLGLWHSCLDRLEIPRAVDLSFDGCRSHHDVRKIVERLLTKEALASRLAGAASKLDQSFQLHPTMGGGGGVTFIHGEDAFAEVVALREALADFEKAKGPAGIIEN